MKRMVENAEKLSKVSEYIDQVGNETQFNGSIYVDQGAYFTGDTTMEGEVFVDGSLEVTFGTFPEQINLTVSDSAWNEDEGRYVYRIGQLRCNQLYYVDLPSTLTHDRTYLKIEVSSDKFRGIIAGSDIRGSQDIFNTVDPRYIIVRNYTSFLVTPQGIVLHIDTII